MQLCRIFRNNKITTSADGSLLFYNLEYQETYRAKSIGAYTESLHKFINASGILDKMRYKDVRILDICLGLGYNCAVTFDKAIQNKIKNKVHIVSVDKDDYLLKLINDTVIFWPEKGYKILKNLLRPSENDFINKTYRNLTMEFYLADAINFIYNLKGKFDAIYFDPFSHKSNPDMWSLNIFEHLKQLLEIDGTLTTFACSKNIRGKMKKAGFEVSPISDLKTSFNQGTICKHLS